MPKLTNPSNLCIYKDLVVYSKLGLKENSLGALAESTLTYSIPTRQQVAASLQAQLPLNCISLRRGSEQK